MNSKLLLLSLLSFGTILPIGENTAKEGLTIIASKLNTVGSDGLSNVANAGNNVADNLPNVGLNAADKLAKTASSIWGLGLVYNACAGIKSWVWPSRSDKIVTMDINATYERLSARDTFKKCLRIKVKEERNDMGIPHDCNSFAAEYAFEAGDIEVENMARTYNKFFPRQS